MPEIHRIAPNDVQDGLAKSLRNKEGTVSDPNYELAALLGPRPSSWQKAKTRQVQIRTESGLRICHVESTDTSEVYRVFWYPCLSCNLDQATLPARYGDRSEGRYLQIEE